MSKSEFIFITKKSLLWTQRKKLRHRY